MTFCSQSSLSARPSTEMSIDMTRVKVDFTGVSSNEKRGFTLVAANRCLDSKTQGAHLCRIPPFPVGRVEEGRDIGRRWACGCVGCVYINLQHTYSIAGICGGAAGRDEVLSLDKRQRQKEGALTKSHVSASFSSRPESPICSSGSLEPECDAAPTFRPAGSDSHLLLKYLCACSEAVQSKEPQLSCRRSQIHIGRCHVLREHTSSSASRLAHRLLHRPFNWQDSELGWISGACPESLKAKSASKAVPAQVAVAGFVLKRVQAAWHEGFQIWREN